jgi:transcriptional antiterminator RfaH
MPILAAETNLNPSDLLDSNFLQNLDQEQCSWWIFYTRPRQEKSLARDLLQRDIAFYLPLVTRRVLTRSRPVRSLVPLFDGYLFVYGSNDDRLRALMTNRAAHVFRCHEGNQLAADLQRIQRLIESGAPLTLEARLQPNQSVRVRSGPLADLEGTVLRRKNQTRLVVWVKMLHQGVSLEIEDCLLEPVL